MFFHHRCVRGPKREATAGPRWAAARRETRRDGVRRVVSPESKRTANGGARRGQSARGDDAGGAARGFARDRDDASPRRRRDAERSKTTTRRRRRDGTRERRVQRETRRALEDELIKEALAAFRARADLIAAGMGAKTWSLIDVSVGTTSQGPRPVVMEARAARYSSMDAAPASLEAGTSEVRVQANGIVELD